MWERDLKLIDKKLNALLDLHISGDVDKELFAAKKKDLTLERTAIVEKLNNNNQSTTQWFEQTERFFDFAHLAYNTFKNPETTIARKKQILQDIGWNLRLRDGNLHWDYKKPFDFLVERKTAFTPVGTPVFGERKKKNTSALAEVSFWRTGRDSNPRSSP